MKKKKGKEEKNKHWTPAHNAYTFLRRQPDRIEMDRCTIQQAHSTTTKKTIDDARKSHTICQNEYTPMETTVQKAPKFDFSRKKKQNIGNVWVRKRNRNAKVQCYMFPLDRCMDKTKNRTKDEMLEK